MKKKRYNSNKGIIITVVVIAVIILFAFIFDSYQDHKFINKDQIAIIPIHGIITASSDDGFSFQSSGVSSGSIVGLIEQANEEESIKAIILEINSGGGAVVASDEIATAVKNSDKPVVAWIREVGASGAYWIASASDLIIANPMSITGSIGVIGSYLEFSGLMEKYGVGYEQLTGGEYKGVGNPFEKLSEEERIILQSKIDTIHEFFINEVAENRNLSVEHVRRVATGMFYLGTEAKDLGLIDMLGDKGDAIAVANDLAGTEDAELVTFKKKTSIFDLITGVSAEAFFNFGRGFGDTFYERSTSLENRFVPIA